MYLLTYDHGGAVLWGCDLLRDTIYEAHEDHVEPRRDARLGSGIDIHIGGMANDDCTDGRVALTRELRVEIYQRVRDGTPVTIPQ